MLNLGDTTTSRVQNKNNMVSLRSDRYSLARNTTKSVDTTFDNMSLIGFLKLVISRSEWAAGFFLPYRAKDVFRTKRKETFGFMA